MTPNTHAGKKALALVLSTVCLSAALLSAGFYQAIPASAQTPQLNQQRRERQQAASWARIRRQEDTARKTGHYNSEYWDQREKRETAYWNRQTQVGNGQIAFEQRQRDHSNANYERTKNAAYAKIRKQEADARRRGIYTDPYWKKVEARNADYWARKDAQQQKYWKSH